jgi:hypothetical protein
MESGHGVRFELEWSPTPGKKPEMQIVTFAPPTYIGRAPIPQLALTVLLALLTDRNPYLWLSAYIGRNISSLCDRGCCMTGDCAGCDLHTRLTPGHCFASGLGNQVASLDKGRILLFTAIWNPTSRFYTPRGPGAWSILWSNVTPLTPNITRVFTHSVVKTPMPKPLRWLARLALPRWIPHLVINEVLGV